MKLPAPWRKISPGECFTYPDQQSRWAELKADVRMELRNFASMKCWIMTRAQSPCSSDSTATPGLLLVLIVAESLPRAD